MRQVAVAEQVKQVGSQALQVGTLLSKYRSMQIQIGLELDSCLCLVESQVVQEIPLLHVKQFELQAVQAELEPSS